MSLCRPLLFPLPILLDILFFSSVFSLPSLSSLCSPVFFFSSVSSLISLLSHHFSPLPLSHSVSRLISITPVLQYSELPAVDAPNAALGLLLSHFTVFGDFQCGSVVDVPKAVRCLLRVFLFHSALQFGAAVDFLKPIPVLYIALFIILSSPASLCSRSAQGLLYNTLQDSWLSCLALQ